MKFALQPFRRLIARRSSASISIQRARAGSVLILVVALLVLLALMGTAYISTARTERYSSAQHSANTQAALLLQGVINTVNSDVVAGLYGSPTVTGASATASTAYRPPSQETPVNGVAAPIGVLTNISYSYNNYDSPQSDIFLGDRIPVYASNSPSTSLMPVRWNGISWPLLADSSGSYTFDSPFENGTTELPAALYLQANRSIIQTYPAVKVEGGQNYPGLIFYVLPNTTLQEAGGVTVAVGAGGGYITPSGYKDAVTYPITAANYSSYVYFAADADGDGIADSALWKLPIGPIDGVTYYAAVRVIDNNSAINASTAWQLTTDSSNTTLFPTGLTLGSTTYPITNFGFFRSNIGLAELLNPTPPGTSPPSAAQEVNALNEYRFTGLIYTPATSPSPSVSLTAPYADPDSTHTSSWIPTDPASSGEADFNFFTVGDMLDQQLARRGANPGYNTATQKFAWIGTEGAGELANRFCLLNPSVGQSLIESLLPNETYTYTNARSTAYLPTQFFNLSSPSLTAANQAGTWFWDQFYPQSSTASPTTPIPPQLRSLLVGSNAISNAVQERYGYATNIKAYSGTTAYQFGDLVTYSSTDLVDPTKTDTYTYVCLASNVTGQSPASIGMTTPHAEVYENQYWARLPWSATATKTSINTANFDQLWLGFCHVMTDSISPAGAASGTPGVQWNPPEQVTPVNALEPQLTMFRSSIRDNRAAAGQGTLLSPMEMMQLRAALAAVNTLDMRDADNDVTSRHIVLYSDGTGHSSVATLGAPEYDVEVYGTEMQPFISEVAAVVDKSTPTNDYIAIELVNPYPTDITIGSSWQFATLTRPTTTSTGAPVITLASIGVGASDLVVPKANANAPGILIIQSSPPSGLVPAAPSGAITVPGLQNAIGKELVILKPRLASGTLSSSTDAKDPYNESNLSDLVPVDQIDLTETDQTAITPALLHYRRADAVASSPPSYAWNFVYPGPYYPNATGTTTSSGGTGSGSGSGSGSGTGSGGSGSGSTSVYAFRQDIQLEADTATAVMGAFGVPKSGAPSAAPTSPTFFTVPLQLNNVNMAGFNHTAAPTSPSSTNCFPFGGFARNADMLQIPFIGAYRIRPYGTAAGSLTMTELNSVSMDSAYAIDTTIATTQANGATAYTADVAPQGATALLPAMPTSVTGANAYNATFYEQVGRFCPVGDSGADGSVRSAAWMDFNDVAIGANPAATYWHYHWAKKLFDYFTVQSPQDDYFPNADPTATITTTTAGGTVSPSIPQKFPDSPGDTSPLPQPTANRSPSVANANGSGAEDTVGVEGLININTAPYSVLASLPFLPKGTNNIDYTPSAVAGQLGTITVPAVGTVDDNADLAAAIIDYRTVNGPFKSIEDLYKVPAFAVENQFLWTAAEPTAAQGYFIASRPNSVDGEDSPRLDFAERFLLLDHVSNLITTRSDSFTCYVLLQGWRGVGTGAPTLAVQRRAAYLLDRTGVTATYSTPSSFPIIPN